ncbi:uncharacterized protein LOC117323675 isoform X2 [Pecten maximus]|uniref:uncharacterized protein LOC117323675 isoform X2 n=1 Tax=Pecten maximus TaxID=6579 RepID=UPI0014581323|nr:uncharacterized protein LOC117323675 isoform X2 [Pecten maximus]
MSTGALQCLSTTVCASLPEPIHPCALLPPTDPDQLKFPDIFNSIQNFKLTKPTWSDYTERCLGGTTAFPTTVHTAVTTETVTTAEGETTSVFHTVTQTLTEAVTNVTIDLKPDTITAGGSKSFNWIIPVAIIAVLLIFIAVIFIICKIYHNSKSFDIKFTVFERIVIRKSSTKQDNNAPLSYHDLYRVEGGDDTGKGDNSETFEQTPLEVIVDSHVKTNDHHIDLQNSNSIPGEGKGSTMTSDSGIGSVDLQIPQTLAAAKSKEHLVKQEELCPESDDNSLAVENVSFTKDNEKAENQEHHLTKHTNCVDVQNGLQQSPVLDQREQDFSNTASEEACASEMEYDGDDKDQGQSRSNNSIPFITETLDIKRNRSSNPQNDTDAQPEVNNVDSPEITNCEGTDIRESRTPEAAYENSNRLQNGSDCPVEDCNVR